MFLRKNNRLEAMIGPNSEFKGDIITQGTFRIDGKVYGVIIADSVVIGESGEVTGDIKARSVVISGSVRGNIKADELVDIKHTGQLLGDIYSRKLSVAEGGIFEGHSHIHKEDAKVIDFPGKEAIST